MANKRLTADQIEICVADHFGYRRNLIVPNVSWGWGLRYEADMVVMRSSGYAIEVEIKISRSDIRADKRKSHLHDSNRFRELWFAVPEDLADDPNIPDRAGVIAVCWRQSSRYSGGYRCKTVRRGKINTNAKKISAESRLKLAELGCMRIWSLKSKLRRRIERE